MHNGEPVIIALHSPTTIMLLGATATLIQNRCQTDLWLTDPTIPGVQFRLVCEVLLPMVGFIYLETRIGAHWAAGLNYPPAVNIVDHGSPIYHVAGTGPVAPIQLPSHLLSGPPYLGPFVHGFLMNWSHTYTMTLQNGLPFYYVRHERGELQRYESLVIPLHVVQITRFLWRAQSQNFRSGFN
jgi:hypothetical protein